MRVINNSILGKNFRLSNLKLNETGLHKIVKFENKKDHLIFLTDDPKKILELLDINFDDIDGIADIEAYSFLIDSPYMKIDYFHEQCGTSKKLLEFGEYLKENNINIVRGYHDIRITEERINDVLGVTYSADRKEIRFVVENFTKEKYKCSGKSLLTHLVDYDARNFQTDIPKFMGSFRSQFEMQKFVVLNSAEAVADYFNKL